MSAAPSNDFFRSLGARQDCARFALPLSTRAALAALLARHRILIVPGWNNSGPQHWQSLWQQEFPSIERVQQREWARPDPDEWVATLDETIRASKKPTVLVAHSLGCVTVARWVAARQHADRQAGERTADSHASGINAMTGTWPVAAALLVAPADVERPAADPALAAFAPIPLSRFPFFAHVVASDNDPCCTEARARELSMQWGASFSLVMQGGHINVQSGAGFWPQGLALLAWMQTQ